MQLSLLKIDVLLLKYQKLLRPKALLKHQACEVAAVSCRPEDAPPIEPVVPEIALEDELDEEDSGVYVCRWPNARVLSRSSREVRKAFADENWFGTITLLSGAETAEVHGLFRVVGGHGQARTA